jgi:hypothetical protein
MRLVGDCPYWAEHIGTDTVASAVLPETKVGVGLIQYVCRRFDKAKSSPVWLIPED